MGSHALTPMPPVGELQQDGHLTVTELAGRVDVTFRPAIAACEPRTVRWAVSPCGSCSSLEAVWGQHLLRDWP